MTPFWVENKSNEEYHAKDGFVSSSGLKTIKRSGHAFKYYTDDEEREETKAMRFGTLAHKALLEGDVFKKNYIVMPEFSGFTKDGKLSNNCGESREKKASWLLQHEGKLVVSQDELDKLKWMVDSVLANEDAVRLLKDGSTEVSGYYSDPETGIECKIRPDFIAHDLNALIDVKTVAECSVEWFKRNRVEDKKFMYHFQMAMYDSGTEQISGKPVDHALWILLESVKPFECIVVPMEQPYMEIGRNEYRKALKTLKECREKDSWPRQSNIQAMHPSHWFMENNEV